MDEVQVRDALDAVDDGKELWSRKARANGQEGNELGQDVIGRHDLALASD